MSIPSRNIVQDYYAIKPVRFNWMTRFEWSVDTAGPGLSRTLTVHLTSSENSESGAELVMSFRDVTNLRFEAAGMVQPLLEVRDISERQWEGVKFEVRDSENETISFLCRDFSFSVREQAG